MRTGEMLTQSTGTQCVALASCSITSKQQQKHRLQVGQERERSLSTWLERFSRDAKVYTIRTAARFIHSRRSSPSRTLRHCCVSGLGLYAAFTFQRRGSNVSQHVRRARRVRQYKGEKSFKVARGHSADIRRGF